MIRLNKNIYSIQEMPRETKFQLMTGTIEEYTNIENTALDRNVSYTQTVMSRDERFRTEIITDGEFSEVEKTCSGWEEFNENRKKYRYRFNGPIYDGCNNVITRTIDLINPSFVIEVLLEKKSYPIDNDFGSLINNLVAKRADVYIENLNDKNTLRQINSIMSGLSFGGDGKSKWYCDYGEQPYIDIDETDDAYIRNEKMELCEGIYIVKKRGKI